MKVFRGLCFLILAFMIIPEAAWGEAACPVRPPDGWSAIPREALDAYQEETATNTPYGKSPRYDCGWQAPESSEWMTYPFILVQVRETGPVPDGFVQELAKLPVSDIASDWEEAFRKTIHEFKPGRPLWDPAARIVWLKTEMEAAGNHRIMALSGMKLTQGGFIAVVGAAQSHQYNRYAPVFMRVIASAGSVEEPPTDK